MGVCLVVLMIRMVKNQVPPHLEALRPMERIAGCAIKESTTSEYKWEDKWTHV